MLMKSSVRLFLTGNMQSLFFRQFIKENADKNNIKGFLRYLQDGRVEVFLEGDKDDVENMVSICSRGPKHSFIRSVERKDERLQDFKDFKILKF